MYIKYMDINEWLAVIQKPVESTTECVLCEMIMKEVDTILQGSKVKEEIESALKSVCDRLSTGDLAKECSNFVMQYTEILIDLLKSIPPKEVCSKLGLCTADKAPAKQQLHHVKLVSEKHNGMNLAYLITKTLTFLKNVYHFMLFLFMYFDFCFNNQMLDTWTIVKTEVFVFSCNQSLVHII